MKYKIVHSTEYLYGDPVPLCHNVLHLKPRRTLHQTVLSDAITVIPNPMARAERVDYFGNPITWFSLAEPHTSLRVEARSEVEVKPMGLATDLWMPAWEQVVNTLLEQRDPATLNARQFSFESPFISIDPQLAQYALPSFPAGRPLLDCVTELTHRIFADFTFDSNATTVGTPVLDVFQHRHGVCQDFAQLQIACLRSLGLAARYVSGYLVTHPPPGQKRLVGADASHAWLGVFFPGVGWIDFDPTNGVLPSVEHITLAWARDYADVSPVRGVVVGGHRHRLDVSVDVELIE